MAAATRFIIKGRNRFVINVTGAFSAADETDTVLIDKSTITGPDGIEPTSIKIDEITWAVGAGFDHVLLEWDHGTDDVLDYFQGQGYMDYRPYGGKDDPNPGTTGDLILTTVGGAANDTYSFLISGKFKA